MSSSPPSPQSSCNSSYGSSSGQKLMNTSNSSITALVPGGVVTTQNISTVIKPKSNNNSLQFVKIQTPELSKKAVEQISLAEETKISREKIKEVEEEWQNNLLNWKSKRRQQFSHTVDSETNDPFAAADPNAGRKIKTFAEIIEQRAKSGNRLGFHLQRYIGSGDEEEDKSQNGVDREIIAENSHDLTQTTDNNNSDLNSHPSNQNQHETHGQAPPTNLRPASAQEEKPFDSFDQQLTAKCDSDKIENSIRSEPDNKHSISLVSSNEAEQINSTLKPGIDAINLNSKNNIILELDTCTKEVSTRCDDDSENSCYEEEDQHEEEHKHHQRIAFEAKLKAFEKLTKPTTQAPKLNQALAHNRVANNGPAALRRTSNESILPPAKDPRRQNVLQLEGANLHENTRSSIPTMIKTSRSQTSSSSSITTSSPDLKSEGSTSDLDFRESQLRIAPPSKEYLNPTFTKTKSNVKPSVQEDISNKFPRYQSHGQIGHVNVFDKVDHRSFDNDQKDLASCISEIDLKCHEQKSNSSLPLIPNCQQIVLPDRKPAIPDRMNMRPTNIYDNDNNIISQTSHREMSHSQIDSYKTQPAQNKPPVVISNPMSPLLDHVGYGQGNISISNNNILHNNNNIIPKQRNLPPQSMSESPRNNPVSQRKLPPIKDDKDRPPPLQVSGKKRCSSCKEELGRGAAAFVVESLSLVYHTNCFRCSVCHVNLSNGFRGVDVRVHAGALHCQNCYSKDGLNYSRV